MRTELSSLTSPSHAEVSSILQSLQQLLQYTVLLQPECHWKIQLGGIGMESKVTELFVPLEGVVGGDADFIATHVTGSIR